MTGLVLDASVALKWAIPAANEPLTDESVRLFRRFVDSEIAFLVPDVFWAEIGNVLWKGVKRQRWSRADAEVIAAEFKAHDFRTVPSQLLLPEALRIAFAYDRNIYDCLYVALAVESQLQLITADERLANALAARFPVKWLGAF
ncbi:MAG: type II toxin-antitoxin system VapC family toxin [Candidatus Sulfotelmatobacter sp.]